MLPSEVSLLWAPGDLLYSLSDAATALACCGASLIKSIGGHLSQFEYVISAWHFDKKCINGHLITSATVLYSSIGESL